MPSYLLPVPPPSDHLVLLHIICMVSSQSLSPNTCSFGDHAIVWGVFWGFLAIGLNLLEHDGV